MRKYALILFVTIFVIFSGSAQSQSELKELYQKYQSGDLSQSEMNKLMELKNKSEGGSGLETEIEEKREKFPQEKDIKNKQKEAKDKKEQLRENKKLQQFLEENPKMKTFFRREDTEDTLKKKMERKNFYNRYYFNEKKYEYGLNLYNLERYGYNIFESPSTYSPVENSSVSENYIVGPGDVINLTLWGGVNSQYEVEVGKNGNIATPDFGEISVAGLTYKELKEKLKGSISSGTRVSISFSKLKTIRVFLTGDSDSPGSYKLSGQATIVNAIFASGGPSKNGSMRNIFLKRNGNVVKKFDLYDFLLRGNSANDTFLMPGDVIYIPPVKNLVAVAGNVKREAIYELREDETLNDLINIAGGLTASADNTNISIERFRKNEGRIVLNINGTNKNKIKNFKLKDGDIIKIYPTTDFNKNAITLQGYVETPRMYEYRENMRVSDIITKEKLLEDTYLQYAALKRKIYPENYYETKPINLYKALFKQNERYDLKLKPEDKIIVFSKEEMQTPSPVFIQGEVRTPGTYDFEKGMTVLDLIHQADGLTNLANKKTAEHVRIDVGDDSVGSQILRNVSIKNIFNNPNNRNINFELEPFDKIFIRRIANYEKNRSITLTGEIKYPGVYYAQKGEKLYDIIKRAGGFTKEAYLRGAFFSREKIRERQEKRIDNLINSLQKNIEQISTNIKDDAKKQSLISLYEQRIQELEESEPTGRLVIELPDSLEKLKNSPYNITINEGDELNIPKKESSIIVLGEVYSPGVFVYEKDKHKVKNYLSMTGGATNKGDIDQAFVIKANGRIISNHYIDEESRTYSFLGNDFLNAKIYPGDTIIVPPKEPKESLLQGLKDWSTVLYNLATTVKITSDIWQQ
ncbi:MAG: hypothetical protein FXF47_06640 [Candidatus Mcinerneyibacterium aminivorans]|uniref:Polysaccharide biosynthesis protein n=1 Tax=Candidatus Mcinerneyibacterium aminivorans TaxID=2703815 RepID=A0A5D0MD70_9BACT|nr:MAG: hypothetical protein FXF47_06640 [Candidatus Mcinerneyibacterium aminivorans]